MLLAVALSAQAAITCQDGQAHDTLAAAVADRTCTELQLDAGTHTEPVEIGRSLSIAGAGPDETVLVCRDEPCVTLLPGADVALSSMTIASGRNAIRASYANLEVRDAALLALAAGPSPLRLRDTDALLEDVVFEVPNYKALSVDAVSGRGHDLTFTDVRFLGTTTKPYGLGTVYALNYGVVCSPCSFGGARVERSLP